MGSKDPPSITGLASEEITAAIEVVSTPLPKVVEPGTAVVDEDDGAAAAGTFPNVDTKTLIKVIRKIPKTDKLLILSADANPLFLCTLY